jgi:lipopolysaccharide transport system permease protein
MTSAGQSRVAAAKPVHRIRARGPVWRVDVRELWAYRELVGILIWRDLKSRYKQTFLGIGWAVGRPLVSMVVFSVVFGGIAGIKAGIPYPLFLYAGMLPWTYCSAALTGTTGSVVSNAALVSKAYFPRLLMPVASAIGQAADFVFALLVLGGLFAWYRTAPSWQALTLPLFLLLGLLTVLGLGFWLSALTVRYRDVPTGLPYLIQIWLYATPIVYPVSSVPERWRILVELNPITAVVNGSRWALLDYGTVGFRPLVASAALGCALLVSGLLYFSAVERRFADVI